MRKTIFAMAAITIAAFTSCSSSNEPKEISPTSTDFTSGELAKLIEVVDKPCQLSYAEQDGTIETQFIKLKVKLRLTKESPELKKVDARDINFTSLLSVAIINLVDVNEVKVQDLDVKSEDLLKLKKLLQGEKGDEETVTFEGEYHNSKDAPKWYEQTAAFTPYLTGDVVVGDDEVDTNKSEDEAVHQAALINDPDGYTNVRAMPDGKAKIVAKIVDGEKFYFDEVLGSNWVKVYRSADAAAECIGYMHNSRVMPVGAANSNDLSFDSHDSDNSEISSVEAEDWDELLDSYEEYVDKYISYVKKAAKGDMTALSEYPSLMTKAQEFSEKMQNAQGVMSSSQWSRYLKITNKMTKAAQEMND